MLIGTAFTVSGQVYLGGALAGTYSISADDSAKNWGYLISPEAGVLLNDNLALGGRLSFGETNTVKQPLSLNAYCSFSPVSYNRFALWAEGGITVVPSGPTGAAANIYISPVLTYLVGNHVLIKTELDFASFSYSFDERGNKSASFGVDTNSILKSVGGVKIGFIYCL